MVQDEMLCWNGMLEKTPLAMDIARASNSKSTSPGRFFSCGVGWHDGKCRDPKEVEGKSIQGGEKGKTAYSQNDISWSQCRSSWGWNFPLRLGVSLFSQAARQTPLQVCRNIPAYMHAYIFAYVHLFFLYLLFYSVFPSISHGTFRAWMHRVSKSGHSCWIFSSHLSPSLPSTTLNSPDRPPPPSLTLPPAPVLSLPLSLSPALPLPPLSALCAPLSLRGSPLIALHITLNHHNNESTLSQKKNPPRGDGPERSYTNRCH